MTKRRSTAIVGNHTGSGPTEPLPCAGRDPRRPRATEMEAFREAIWGHYREHGRVFPWRETRDPYRILVSEVMLQQTQTERVVAKYARFLERFGDFGALARAPLADVLAAWQGLGYNRRALALARLAHEVVERHGGELPRSVDELEALPGIGPCTAGAVAAFAFGIPSVFVETNIRAVFIDRFFASRERVADAEVLPLVEAALDRENPREWYYALMDYGVMLKKSGPDPGRRSACHRRQSAFEGSNRQLRARVLRALIGGGAAAGEIAERAASTPAAVDAPLEELVGEGFVVREGGGYRIA